MNSFQYELDLKVGEEATNNIGEWLDRIKYRSYHVGTNMKGSAKSILRPCNNNKLNSNKLGSTKVN